MEADATVQSIARWRLGGDLRIELVHADADVWLSQASGLFDLAYVDCRPGKYLRLPDLLALLKPGALYGSVHVVEQRFDSSSGGTRPPPMFTRTDSTAVVAGRSPSTAPRRFGKKRWLRAGAAADGAPLPTAGGSLPFS
ncbi:hypothetical protein [Streptomyces roseolus]|uniref:hypothetical protein n=1 Tax=Streptomyces roseolus TaxID=67358 RepID=UPI0037A45A76